jgi:hypothetical protein
MKRQNSESRRKCLTERTGRRFRIRKRAFRIMEVTSAAMPQNFSLREMTYHIVVFTSQDTVL